MSPGKALKILEILTTGEEVGIQTWNLENPFQVLIGTVLSQRTRDESTEKASAALFSRYKTPKQIENAPLKEIEKLIKPSGFYKVKARRVKEISSIILKDYGGKVPDTVEELVAIPGVGRKTAGCVLVYAFGKPAIPVDTHVHKVSNRLGLVKTKRPEQTEQELMKIIPKDMWITVNNTMVRFGQQVCKPVKPRCWDCPVYKLCEYMPKNKAHK